MNHEEKLDEALKFLLKYNAGSFIYYLDDNIGRNSKTIEYLNNEDRIIRHFKNINIEEKYHMPIIYHLIGDGFVKPVWTPPEEQEKGHVPSQIMITYKGIAFIDDGGYIKKKRMDKLKKNLLSAQTWAIIVGTTLTGLWSLYQFEKIFYHIIH